MRRNDAVALALGAAVVGGVALAARHRRLTRVTGSVSTTGSTAIEPLSGLPRATVTKAFNYPIVIVSRGALTGGKPLGPPFGVPNEPVDLVIAVLNQEELNTITRGYVLGWYRADGSFEPVSETVDKTIIVRFPNVALKRYLARPGGVP